jgi:ABC-type transport system substrate-binding protein
MVITDYSDFSTMFSAFQSGQVDITDWPVQPPDITSFCANPDMWCSQSEPELGIFQLDVNNHAPFLGQAMEIARPSLVGSMTNAVSSPTSACAGGLGQLTLSVVNVENNTQPFKDSLNTVTISNQPSGSPSVKVNDNGGASPTGSYKFPCILAGTYLLTSTMVTGNATTGTHLGCSSVTGCTVAISPGSGGLGAAVSATWNVVWNSPSTLTPTAASSNIMKAIAHLVDKPEFVQRDAVLNGQATCDDIMLAPAHLIPGSPCVSRLGLPGSPFPASVLTKECSNLSLDTIITSCNPISAYNLVDDNIGSSAVWWGVPGRTARGSVVVGYSGHADIDAACQYLQRAGFTLSGATTAPAGTQPNTCAELAVNSVGTNAPNATSYTHFTAPSGTHLVLLLRTDPPRGHFGQIVADSLNMFFGSPNDSGTCGPFPSPCTQTAPGTATILYVVRGGALSPTTRFETISVAVPLIFEDGGVGKADIWNLYTGGYALPSTPDFLFSNYHSQFASFDCGGPANLFPSNYDFHCDPAFDAITNAGEFQAVSTPTLSGSATIFSEAAARTYDVPINMAVYSRIQQFAALNAWNWEQVGTGQGSSVVTQKGHGTQGSFWSPLNMRQVPGYVPISSTFAGGGGNPNLIRRGFSQDPITVNPYQAFTPWDLEIIGDVFDTLVKVNPQTAGANQQVIDWMTTSHSSSFNPNELGCIAGPSVATTTCSTGITTQTWHLRNDLVFQDGTPVTANDVVYSILTSRDTPSANAFSNVAFVTNAAALDSRTIQVKLESNSAYYEQNIGSIPIIPQHIWQGPGGSICGSVSQMSTPAGPVNVVANGPASACADPSFDPTTCTGTAGPVAGCGITFPDGSVQGIFTGSGPYVCKNVGPNTSQAFGKVGGTCIQNSLFGIFFCGLVMCEQSRLFLTAFPNYMRGLRGGQGNSLQKESWADYNDDGVVNILDASNAAFFFDSTNSYWAHPRYSCSPTATKVDICVMAALVVFFDEGLTAPFGGNNLNPSSQLNILDPQIDPYSTQLAGSNVCTYYQSTTTSASRLQLGMCGTSSSGSSPGGHMITSTASVINADGTLGITTTGGVTINGGMITSAWSPPLTGGTQYLVRFFDNGAQIAQFYVTL